MNNLLSLYQPVAFRPLIPHRFAAAMFVGILSLQIQAGEAWTNWNWRAIGLFIPQTNITVGFPIEASIVVSNTFHESRSFPNLSGDPCGCGFGNFLITELSSGQEISCRTPKYQRGDFTGCFSITLAPKQIHSYNFDLNAVFAITNSGKYSIKVVAVLPFAEPQTNYSYTTVMTPQIIINVLPKIQTNAPPK